MEEKMERLASWSQRWKFAAGIAYWSILLVFLFSRCRLVVGDNSVLAKERVVQFLLLTAVTFAAAAVWICRFLGRTIKKKTRTVTIWQFLLLFADAAYLFFQMECINNPLLSDMDTAYMALNVLVIFLLLLILFLVLNSWRRVMLVGNVCFLIISLVFYFVYHFRGEPFQFIDVFSVGTAMEVAGGYDFTLTREIVIFIVLSLSLTALCWQCRDYRLVGTLKWKLIMRGALVLFLCVLYYCYLNTGWNGDLGIMTDLYRPYETYQEYGTTVGFLCVAKYMRLTPPAGYSLQEVEELADSVTTGSGEPEGKVKPVNIICIMNESWADYRYLGNFTVNEPYMQFYDSMRENTIKGHTLVCIRGGGTAKTEYEFLTGNSVKRFPGMVPYVSYFTHDQYSLVTTLKDQGYVVEAMHPNKGSNWKRTSAYRLLQFEKFFTIDDFPSSTERIRQHISDRANYEKIIERVESKKKKDDPYFIFDVTMQNHGGYTNISYKGDVQTVGYANHDVNQYLSLLKESDDALRYLIKYFETCDEPTLVVMFGDHYPDLPESFTKWITQKSYEESSLAEQQRYFATPFFIWANYDIPQEEGVLTSTNYLSTMMLELTGLKMTPYNYYLAGLREEMPALNHLGYMDADGDFISWDAVDSYYEKIEQQYEALQYNELAEDARRLDGFFTVAGSEG